MERARQSDTWALASTDARPWLLMLWATAWEQTPCGALPNDDALIAARLGMPAKLFAKHKAILLRKWWVAEDGRLYHDVLVQRVTEMMERRRKESDRKALARAKKDVEDQRSPADVPRDKHGTPTGFHPQGDTGTGTGTSTGINTLQRTQSAGEPESRETAESLRALLEAEGHKPTPAGAICKAMQAAGLQAVNPGDPRLLAMIAQGATTEEFVGAATDAVAKQKGFAWALTALAGKRTDAQALKLAPPADGGPTAWHETQGGVDAMASRLGLPKWDGCTPWRGFRKTIVEAAEAARIAA